MKLLLLASIDSWYARDIMRAAKDRHDMIVGRHLDLHCALKDRRHEVRAEGRSLAELDAVMVRTMPAGSLEQVVFRMDLLARLELAGCLIVNPAKAIETAVDKYLTLAKLQAGGLDVPATWVGQTVEEAMHAYECLGSDVVVKPLFGAEGRGIHRLHDCDAAFRCFKMLADLQAVIYLQEFVPHEGCDWRLLVVGHEVFGIRRCHPHDWRTNIQRGAKAEPLAVTDMLAEVARRATSLVGASIAGVDILPARDGRALVLEVNAVPGWRATAQTLNIDVARLCLDHIEQLLSQSRPGE